MDDEGYLWFGSGSWLIRLNPDDESFIRVALPEEFEGSPFATAFTVFLKSKSGDLFFANGGGLIQITPDQFRPDILSPPVVLTDFRIDNLPVSIAEDSPLTSHISSMSAIQLAHDQRDITLEFAALDFDNPERNTYAYQLENFDEDWVEKMASLGQLTAGIAHEIKNPLNFVNNFSALSADLVDEIAQYIAGRTDPSISDIREEEVDEALATLKMNVQKINQHGRRADGIIRSMLEHSRTGRGERRPVDINKLVDEYVNLAYHSQRASRSDTIHRVDGETHSYGQANQEIDVEVIKTYDEKVGELEIYPQEIGRVLINLLDNAFYAVHERTQIEADHVPQVHIKTVQKNGDVEVRIEDNGVGIPRGSRDKIFEPFFTTKPTGSGTGLGLSLSHDIVVKGHGGELTVESREGEGATFTIRLPNGD